MFVCDAPEIVSRVRAMNAGKVLGVFSRHGPVNVRLNRDGVKCVFASLLRGENHPGGCAGLSQMEVCFLLSVLRNWRLFVTANPSINTLYGATASSPNLPCISILSLRVSGE